MITLTTSGDSVVFNFDNNGHYLQEGTIEVPKNSLSLVIDASDMVTFKKANVNDVFVSATLAELGMTKEQLIAFYEENMVGGNGLPTEEIQEMIDESVSGYADSVLYNSTSKYVEFYHGGTGGTKVYEFDASDFVIDGMIDDVRIETISGVSYLVIDFNTASGKEDIQIPLTDIFNPSDYYTKTEVDQALSGKQDTLISGTNIKTINNESLLGSGNIDIQGGGGGGKAISAGRGISITTGETADTVSFNLPISAGTGNNSIIEGSSTSAMSSGDHAEGNRTYAKGNGYPAHAEGSQTSAMSYNCHAEGRSTKASEECAHAEGKSTEASGEASHAEGNGSKAAAYFSHAEGYNTSATSISNVSGIQTYMGHQARHAEGCNTKANNGSTHTEGYYTNANNFGEHASGVYNVSNSASTTFGNSGNTLFSVGNGTADNARHNAFEIRQNGDIYITSGGTDIKLQDNIGGGGSVTIDPTLDSGSTNAVANSAITTALDAKQDTLVSGTNIKTINNQSILGSGNIDIQGGGGGKAIEAGRGISITTGETADTVSFNIPMYDRGNFSISECHQENSKPNCGSNFCHIEQPNGGIGGTSNSSHKEGLNTIIGNFCTSSHVEGYYSKINDNSPYSHAEGYYSQINNPREHASGSYNVSNKANNTWGDSGNTLFSVGNGTADNARHNAFEIRQNGDIYISSGGTDIKLQDNLGSTIEISSAITSGDTNPVQGGAIYDELRVGTPAQEVVLEWEQSDGGVSTNYPSGCTKLTVEVDENEMTSGGYTLYNDNYDCFGTFAIESNDGVITVTTHDCSSNPTTSITYSISGNVVTIEYPTITGVTVIGTNYDNYWTFKAIGEGEAKSLKEYTYDKFDEVEEVTAAALNLLNERVSEDEEVTAAALTTLSDNFDGLKLKKVTQALYDAMVSGGTIDNQTLYVVIN